MPVRRLLATALLLLTAALAALGAAADRPRRALGGLPARSPRAAPSAPAPEPAQPLRSRPRRTPATICRSRCSSPSSRGWCASARSSGWRVRAFRAREGRLRRSARARRAGPIPEPAPSPSRRRRRRGGRAARATARRARPRRLAADYLDVVAAGGRRPVMDLAGAARLGVEHAAGRWGAPGPVGCSSARAAAGQRRALRRGRGLLSEPAPPVQATTGQHWADGSPRPRGPRPLPAASRMSRIT